MIFGKAKVDPAGAAITRFWSWWAKARDRDLTDAGLIEQMHQRVSAIDPALEWEFASGMSARHALVVSAGGDPALRSLTERWRRVPWSAPGPTARSGRPRPWILDGRR